MVRGWEVVVTVGMDDWVISTAVGVCKDAVGLAVVRGWEVVGVDVIVDWIITTVGLVNDVYGCVVALAA